MPTDVRLRGHVEILKLVMDNYLTHLAQTWQDGAAGVAGSVRAVLNAVATPVRVDPDLDRSVNAELRRLRRTHDSPLSHLCDRLGIEPGEEIVVAAAAWCELDPQLASVFGVLHDDGRRRFASCGLLHLIFEPFGVAVPFEPMRLVELGMLMPAGPSERLALTPTAREVISGQLRRPAQNPQLPNRLEGMVQPLVDLLTSASGPVTLRGAGGSGRHDLAKAAARQIGAATVGAERSTNELRMLARTSLAVPVLSSDLPDEVNWAPEDGPLIWITDSDGRPRGAHVVDVPNPSREESVRLWRNAMRSLGIARPGDSPRRLADRFRFTETDIESATSRAHFLAGMEARDPEAADVWTAAQRGPDVDLGLVATRIVPAFTLDDLVLSDQTRSQLDELISQVQLRSQVFDRWGFRARMPRGDGVAALFSGLPGTGKTTAAEAIANRLSADLLRVDLSKVASKWVGETAKNLAVAFREAERSGALLLFDEADALFGKRTEVRDAHDRYANFDVSYLLQRVESFAGLVILSTNKPGNIDEALIRRLRFLVRFESPGRDSRRDIWVRSIPRGAVGRIEWDSIAEHDLSGGHIQNAALAAAFMAATARHRIDQPDLERAVAREYEKLERAVPRRAAPDEFAIA